MIKLLTFFLTIGVFLYCPLTLFGSSHKTNAHLKINRHSKIANYSVDTDQLLYKIALNSGLIKKGDEEKQSKEAVKNKQSLIQTD